MRRIGNLYEKIYDMDNLRLAEKNAIKGKSKQYGVVKYLKNREENLIKIHNSLKDQTYSTSPYKLFVIKEPKIRNISKSPFPDRIVQHAIMNVTESIWVSSLTFDTYSCIKNRGIHLAVKKLKKCLKNKDETQYCLKIDVKKFYESLNHDILKQILKKKIKDEKLLNLLEDIIDSVNNGVPLGNFTSQWLANLYLNSFDHWIKEKLKVKYYFRYCDDIVILSDSKEKLHYYLYEIRSYLSTVKLEIKSNYQVFPVSSRGINFLGYIFYHTHVLLRKNIKNNFKNAVKKNKIKSIPSYLGWIKYCNGKHLLKSLKL